MTRRMTATRAEAALSITAWPTAAVNSTTHRYLEPLDVARSLDVPNPTRANPCPSNRGWRRVGLENGRIDAFLVDLQGVGNDSSLSERSRSTGRMNV